MTRFKVGDRVVLKTPNFPNYNGRKGTIERLFGDDFGTERLSMKVDKIFYSHGNKIEKIDGDLYYFKKLRKKYKPLEVGDRVVLD